MFKFFEIKKVLEIMYDHKINNSLTKTNPQNKSCIASCVRLGWEGGISTFFHLFTMRFPLFHIPCYFAGSGRSSNDSIWPGGCRANG